MVSKIALGIDLGGTDIKVGVVDELGSLLDFYVYPTPKTCAEDIVDSIAHIIAVKEKKHAATLLVGIGLPGVINAKTREVVMASNLVSKDYPLRKAIEGAVGRQIVIDNDANMAAIGEWWKGAGKEYKDFVLLTLGTGIGAGIIIRNEIYRGSGGQAGEIGHTIVFPGGEPCACGKNGCLETYASAAAVARRYSTAEGWDIKTETVFELAREGNCSASKIIEEAVEALSLAIYNYILLYDPESVILGGGMIQAGEQLLRPIRIRIAALLGIYPSNQAIKVRPAELGNKAGVFGAAKSAFDMNKD